MDEVVETVVGQAAKVADAVREAAGKVIGAGDAAPLPESRAALLELHDAARRRRDAAAPSSHERVEASFELERIEIQIARVERAMDPPLV